MDKSTPRPWCLDTGREGWWTIADEANGWVIGQRSEWPSRAEMSAANGALIVKAVNRDGTFDALVEALRAMLDAPVPEPSIEREFLDHARFQDACARARAALALATKETP